MPRLMMQRLPPLPLVALAAAIALAGCGRRGEPELPSAQPRPETASPLPTAPDKSATRIERPKQPFLFDPLL